jgi:glyoxylase-like metal-dependent hydrolase (beta-lactamase superfamily II)
MTWIRTCLALTVLGLTTVHTADDWTHFRPNGGVVADDPALPDTWSPTQNIAWKADVPGLGWGSPIVSGDHVFVTAAVGDEPKPAPGLVIEDGKAPSTPTYWQIPANAVFRWVLYDFDFNTGKLRWQRELHAGTPVTPRYHRNSFATETPVTDGRHVYIFHAPAGLLVAVDYQGQIAWSTKIDQPATGPEGGPFGPAASPALHRNRLFLVSDEHPGVWRLAGYDTATGKEVWRNQEPKTTRGFGWSTPYVWENGQRTEIVTVSNRRVSSFDVDGKPLWHLNGLSGSTTPTPFAADGLLYASSGYPGAFRPFYAIRPGASGDISLKEGETGNDFVAWSNPTLATYLPSPIVYRGQVCNLYSRGLFTCHDAKTGREIYGRQRIDPQASGFSGSPWAYNGKIFLPSEDGDVYVVDAGPQFKILHKNSLGEMIGNATPAIVRGSVVLRTASSLWRIARMPAAAAQKPSAPPDAPQKPAATPQKPAAAPFTLTQIGPSVWAAIHNPKSEAGSGGNGGFIVGEDGVVVVDTFMNVDAAKRLVGEIRKITSLPIKFAVNTHYHVDHVVGNRVFADAGAAILAHRNVKGWAVSENLKLLGPGPKPEFVELVNSIMPPNIGYDGATNIHLGSRTVQVVSFPGHTGGDSIVIVPDANVAFAGDLFWRNIVPNMINSSTKAWIATLDSMVKNGAGFTFVPGHGEIGTAQDVVAFRDYLATVLTLVTDARAQGRTGKALSEAVMPALTSKYGEWDYFKYLAPLNIEQIDLELSGKKELPRPEPGN